jgi:hypothetical protein
MKPSRVTILVLAASTLLAAEPICHRLVLPAVHKHYSKATITKWTAYNARHHIKPKAKEILAELDIVCAEIKTQDVDQVGFILPTDGPLWIDDEVSVPVDTVGLVVPAESDFYLPAGHTETNSIPSQVPEPSSIYLMITGFVGMLAGSSRKWTKG